MSRYDNLIASVGTCPCLCSNLGIGEQCAVLAQIQNGLFIVPTTEIALQAKAQLDALSINSEVVVDYDKLFTLSTFKSNLYTISMLKALKKLSCGNTIVIGTPKLLTSFVPTLATFKANALTLTKGKQYSIGDIEKSLVRIGYKKVESVTTQGEFAVRGDIVDIFEATMDNPIRLDFFDVELENIYSFDFISIEKLSQFNECVIAPNKLTLLDEKQKQNIILELEKLQTKDEQFLLLKNALERGDDIPCEFLSIFENCFQPLHSNLPIIISSYLQVESVYAKHFEETTEKIKTLFANNFEKYLKNIKNISEIYKNNDKNLIFLDNFDLNNTDIKIKYKLKSAKSFEFETIIFPSFLQNIFAIKKSFEPYLDKQIYLCLSSQDTLDAVKKILNDLHIGYSLNKNTKGIVLTQLTIPYNICFKDDEKLYIGSTNFAHKKVVKQASKTSLKYLPKAGEYVVHSTHGIGKCEGVVTVNVGGVDKEFFKLTYRGGDTLYVPYENADCLSLYLSDGADNVTLNKLGGKEFFNQKQKAIQSIEDMSTELLELYAKRKATVGYKYPEDDYLYTEFENAFKYTETNDQLLAIADIKRDMQSGKVMDRLICGDVGFGKTEVAIRALFKAVESGKQVAFLAPTTILSLQHYMTVCERTKDFGVKVEMLNRFRSSKEQKQILQDLRDGKINVICGTHRLLSEDVKFNDLGLLILDEEQRFGVKAKEHIKQIKNNVDVLTLSATPIPRTLSMSLMSIRDISIINTPPVDRLPVKTYVLCYNEDIVVNAIREELNRGGQVLIVYNNINNIYKLAEQLKQKLNDENAHFDVAHGQMAELALENAVKRLYDHETNVFVSTTLIENGVDLPKANTLIVIDSDKLGLSQMYQLRGRVGRNTEQAYAYFTYANSKCLTEDATTRLQAIAENTELGSGFKIAMRDLSIRGAGELLGKIQHGHMIKIGYDMYSKLLNDTLKRLKGEKVTLDKEVKIDIAITSKIPTTFIEDESERLKVIAKISNITDKNSARTTLNELMISYGKLPKEIYYLTNIALIKSLAIKQNVKQILINKSKMSIIYYNEVELAKIMDKVKRYPHFHFEKSALPTISLDTNTFNVLSAITYFIEYLSAN